MGAGGGGTVKMNEIKTTLASSKMYSYIKRNDYKHLDLLFDTSFTFHIV